MSSPHPRAEAGPCAGDLTPTEACQRLVAEGYEGDLDAARHRGSVNGWKGRGLPWRQT
jgi:hypothetical protein